MSQLTFAQLEQLWTANGGSPAWAPTMAAVALVESGGNTGALNNDPSTGDYSVGLWQINYYGDLYNGRVQEYGTPANLQADPNAQAQAAINLLGNGAGITNWEGDAVGKSVIARGGALTQQQAAYYAELQGAGGSGGVATTAAGVAGVGAAAQEGPRWLGLLNPGRCVFPPGGYVIPHTSSTICIVDALAARKIKGYTVMAIGAGGLVLGLVLVAALGLKRGASTPAGKAALGLGKAVPGPVGTVSRAASGSGGRTTTRRPRAAPDPDTEAFQQGRRQAIRRQGRETEHSRITGARSRASDDRERREGFPGYTS